ncbi:MAG: sialidase family protein [Eubacteriales bacterium]|nr:sialidase family protein [Eubacteriales bacterium]
MLDHVTLTVCPYSETSPRQSEGDLIELSDGSLLLGWTCFTGGHEDFSAAHIAGRRSVDGGLTWSDAFVLQANRGGANTMSVSFLRYHSELLMFFLIKDDSYTSCHCYVRRSGDDGRTWGEPIKVSAQPGYHVVNNARVLLTAYGRILVPAAWNQDERSGHALGLCFYSDDGGMSWQQGRQPVELAASRTGVQEPGLVELRDGSLMMIIRSDLGYIYQCQSKDGGDSWSSPEPMPLVSGVSPATVKRLPETGQLLMIWNPTVFGRFAGWRDRWPLCSAVSDDDGRTWHHIRYLEQTPGICHAYTSMTVIDHSLYLTYYEWQDLPGRRNFEGTSLKLNIIPLSHVLP